MKIAKGVVVATLLGAVSWGVDWIFKSQGWWSPGASTVALILGAIAALSVTELEPGGRWMTQQIMPLAIVLLGFGLDLELFMEPEVGVMGMTVALSAAVTCFISSYFLGRLLKIDIGSSVAIGAGGAICGNSAVIAVAPSLKLSEERFAVILAMVNIMGLLTFVLTPVLATSLGLSELQGGTWAGAVIHAVPQAVAAGESIGDDALVIATAVKLSRVSLLVLLVPMCAWVGHRIEKSDVETAKGIPIPMFVPGFLMAACLATWVSPETFNSGMMQAARTLLLPLLAAVGFFINKRSMEHSGGPVLLVGAVSTLLMMLVSLGVLQWIN